MPYESGHFGTGFSWDTHLNKGTLVLPQIQYGTAGPSGVRGHEKVPGQLWPFEVPAGAQESLHFWPREVPTPD